jgi:thiamine biosynthesis lipoprotein
MLTVHQSNIALGSPTGLTIVSDVGQATIDEWFRLLWLKIFQFEQRFSRFLPDSELSQFNRSAGVTKAISSDFYDLLVASRNMSALTGGLYNPFILPALQSVGYVKSMVAAHAHDPVDDFSSRHVVPFDRLVIKSDSASIPYGTAIDFGGIGKGYLADKLASFTGELSGLSGFWFSLGGDIITGGKDGDGKPWLIHIEDTANKPVGYAGSIRASGSHTIAVATSSILRRTGAKEGKSWHHIIDPRTNLPAQSDVATASISCESALLADTLASCAIIVGNQGAIPLAESNHATGVLLQLKNGQKQAWGEIDLLA